MKFVILFPLFILSPIYSFCQLSIPIKFVFYPNISQAIYQHDESIENWIFQGIKENEITDFSFSAGLHTRLSLNEKWGFAFGINYMLTGYKTKSEEIRPSIAADRVSFSRYRMENLEIPLQIERTVFKSNKARFFFVSGPSLWFNISNKEINIDIFENGNISKNIYQNNPDEFKAVNIAASVGVGIEWLPNEKYAFYLQPMAQTGLLGMALDAPLNRDIFNFGVATGIILK